MPLPIISKRFSKTSNEVLWLGFVLILILSCFGYIAVHTAKERQIDAWKKQLDSVTLTLALQTSQSIDTATVVLDTVYTTVLRYNIQDELEFRKKMSSKEVFDILQNRKLGLSQIEVVAVVANNGDNLNFSRFYPITPINLSERDYFKAHRDDPKLSLYISEPVKNKGNGKWTFYITRRINNTAGEFLGLVIVGMSVDYLTDFYQQISENLGQNITINLIRQDLKLLARFPNKDEAIGGNINQGAAYKIVKEQNKDAGVMELNNIRASTGQSEHRLVSVRVVRKYPLINAIVVPMDEVLTSWYKIATQIWIITFMGILAIIVGIRYFIHAIQIKEQGIKELEELKVAAENANQTKSKFLAIMSHEIRTPLNGILGMAQILLSQKLNEKDRDQHVKTIINSGNILQTLLNDILDFSKVEAGKIELVDSPINPKHLIQETIDLFSELANKKNLKLQKVWIGPENQYYLADPLRLRQMLSNLTSNAIKFTDQGSIRIAAKEVVRDGNRAILEFAITDTGMGISAEDQTLLFKSFSQIHHSQMSIHTGSGLGLSIVASLVDVMGGVYGVDSTIGKGSTFWFRIPAKCLDSDESYQSSPDQVDQVLIGSVENSNFLGRILIAEDNSTNRQVLTAMIKNLLPNVQIDTVVNGSEAIDAVKLFPNYDIVFMDIQMPVMDGMTASQKIREYQRANHLQKTPIIAVTAYAYAEDRSKYLSMGKDFLAKPIELNKLKTCLNNWLFKKETPIYMEENVALQNTALIFNKAQMLERLGGDQRLASSIIQSATQEMPKYIENLHVAIKEDDWVQVKSIVHTLKGLIMQIGGDVLARDIVKLEDILRNGGYIHQDNVTHIEREYALLKEEMIKDGIVSVSSLYPQE